MTLIYEDHSSYDVLQDPVAHLRLDLQCNPGQVNSVVDFLAGIEGKAGIYRASFEMKVIAPSIPSQELTMPVPEPEGSKHGEQSIQLPDSNDSREGFGGAGRLSEEGRAAEIGNQDEQPELGRSAGESPARSRQRNA